MALMLLAGAGYALYKQQQDTEPTKEFKDYELDPAVVRFFNDEKEDETTITSTKILGFIEFLPSELAMGQYSNSFTTITFYEGDYLKIKAELECRMNEVLKVNPWLGGRLVVKPGEEDLKLWYDPECKDIPSNIYTCHEPGVIPLQRSTKYRQYKDYLPDYSVCVPPLQGLIGTNHPVFKVTVVPDVIEHHERFAVIVSQSHMIGDAHTYYKIFHMLFNSKENKNNDSTNNNNNNTNNNNCRRMINTAPVEHMNPIRRSDVKYHIEKHMGIQEASYIDKAHPNMVDEMVDMVASKIDADNVVNNQKKKKKKTMLFTVNEKWLEAKTKECIAAKREEFSEKIANRKEELKEKIETFHKNLENQNTSGDIFFQQDELNRLNHGTATTTTTTRTQSSGSMDGTNNNISSSSISSSSFNDDDEIHPTDVLLSWWFNTSDADIGLIPHHLRKELNVLSEMHAGNYNTPIPYTKPDYKTPYQIHESIKQGKRVFSKYFETPLPRITTGYSFAMGVDWCKHYSGRYWNNNDHSNNEKHQEDGSTNENENGIVDDGIKKDLHVPFFTDSDIAVIPTKMDVCLLFTAKTGQQQHRRRDELDDDDDVGSDDDARIGVLIVATEAICDKIAECGIIDEDIKTNKTAEITSNRRSSYIDFESLSVEMVLSEEELNEDEDEEEGVVNTIIGIDNENGNIDIGTRTLNGEAAAAAVAVD